MRFSRIAVLGALLVIQVLHCKAYAAPDDKGPADELPFGAIRTFGDARFADTAGVQNLSFSPDGKSLVSSDQHDLDLWDIKTGLHRGLFSRPKLKLLWAWFQKDGKLLVYAQNFQVMPSLLLIDPVTDQDAAACPLPQERAGSVMAQSESAGRVIYGSRTLTLLDSANGKVIKALGDRPGMTVGLKMMSLPADFSADGKRILLINSQGKAVLLDARTGEPTGDAAIPAVRGAVLLSDQNQIVSGDERLDVYDIHSGKKIQTLPGDPGPTNQIVRGRPPIIRISASPANGLLAALTSDQPARVIIWDALKNPAPVPRVFCTIQNDAKALTWSCDGSMLAVSGGAGRIQIIDIARLQSLFPPGKPESIDAVCTTPDGKAILEADLHGQVTRWDLDTGTIQASNALAPPNFGRNIKFLQVFQEDGSIVAATENGNVEFLDPKTLETRRLIGGEPGVFAAAMANDGPLIAQRRDKGVRIWNLKSGDSVRRISEPQNEQWDHFALSQMRSAFVVANAKGLQSYDISTAAPGVFSDWSDNYFSVSSVAFSPAGSWLVAAGFSGVSGYPSDHLLAPTTRLSPWQFPLQSTPDISFSNCGTYVAAIGFSFTGPQQGYGRTHGFILEPGHSIFACQLSINLGSIGRICFVPHRPLVVTTSAYGLATVWDLSVLLRLEKDKDKSDEELFDDLKDDAPATALRAGLVLL